MVRSFFRGLRGLAALAAVAALLCAIGGAETRGDQAAFFGMLFPQLVFGEATPGEAVAL